MCEVCFPVWAQVGFWCHTILAIVVLFLGAVVRFVSDDDNGQQTGRWMMVIAPVWPLAVAWIWIREAWVLAGSPSAIAALRRVRSWLLRGERRKPPRDEGAYRTRSGS